MIKIAYNPKTSILILKDTNMKKYIIIALLVNYSYLLLATQDEAREIVTLSNTPPVIHFTSQNVEKFDYIVNLIKGLEGKLDKKVLKATKKALNDELTSWSGKTHMVTRNTGMGKFQGVEDTEGYSLLSKAINEILDRH
jgi:hypothetical protein